MNTPAIVPTAAPTTAQGLAPTRFAPAAAAPKSIAQVIAARMPATTTTQTGIRVKPSTQAASAIPPKTSVAPGSAGRIGPGHADRHQRHGEHPQYDAHRLPCLLVDNVH